MSQKASANPHKSGWLRRDLEEARRELKEYPAAIRPYLDGSYRRARSAEVTE